MHLHIVDSEGIKYCGNTVNLYNAAGVLVGSQIINAQSGIGSNDTSALVSFTGWIRMRPPRPRSSRSLTACRITRLERHGGGQQ